MPLIWQTDTIRFVPPSDPEEWIDLKRELSSGEDDEIWELVVKAEVHGGDTAKDLTFGFRVTTINRERVRRSVVAWSYMRDGAPVPVDVETIDKIDRRTFADLVAKVDELNPLGTPGATKATSTGSSPGTPVTVANGRRPK
jgi:hypothetical protein